jgi:hypothetical protein
MRLAGVTHPDCVQKDLLTAQLTKKLTGVGGL